MWSKHPVDSPERVEQMRLIYNECLPYLATKPLPERTYEAQQEWWWALKHPVVAHIYEDEARQPIAFVMVQWKPDGTITPLFGISGKGRGHNLARTLIQDYLVEARGPLHGSQLVSHTAIRKLNQEVGWIVQEEKDGVEYLYHPNKQNYPDYDAIVEYHGY